MINILEQLLSKSDNKRIIKRYLKFIERHRNSGNVKHHILPKSRDLFPEYSNLKSYPDNCAFVSDRVHFIAHMMLYQIFPDKTMVYSAYRMSHYEGIKINSKLYQKLREDYRAAQRSAAIKQHANMTDEQKTIRSAKISKKMSDTVTAKDIEGNVVKIPKEDFDDTYVGVTKGKLLLRNDIGEYFSVNEDDPRYLSGELYGPNKGKKNPFNTKSGKDNHLYGKKLKRVECPYCGTVGGGPSMKRFHFDNCRRK